MSISISILVIIYFLNDIIHIMTVTLSAGNGMEKSHVNKSPYLHLRAGLCKVNSAIIQHSSSVRTSEVTIDTHMQFIWLN